MEYARRMAEVFVELADTLVDAFDVVDFLQNLTDRCVELLGADAAGLMLSDQRGGVRLLAATMERARLPELFELQVQGARAWTASAADAPSPTFSWASPGSSGPSSPPRRSRPASAPPMPCRCGSEVR